MFGRLNVGDNPLGVQARRHPPCGAHEAIGKRVMADADQDALVGRPGLGDGVVAPVALHLRVDAVGGAAQRQLAQRDQVALAKEALDRPFGLLRDVDLAFLEALEQVVDATPVPVLAIGGISSETVRELAGTGCAGFAAIGWFADGDDRAIAERLRGVSWR